MVFHSTSQLLLMCYFSERMTLHVVIRPPLLSGDNGNQDDNWEWEAEGGMSTCKCQLESHSANSVQNQTWKVSFSRSYQLG